jgi:hypothetical protein
MLELQEVLSQVEAEGILRLSKNPEWLNFITMLSLKRDKLTKSLLTCHDGDVNVHRGAILMLQKIIGLKEEATLFIENYNRQEREE